MNARNNIVEVSIVNSKTTCCSGIYQYDRGMKLRIRGVDTSLNIANIKLHYAYPGLAEVIPVTPDSFTNGV